LIFVWLYRLFPSLLEAAVVFKPETLVRWLIGSIRRECLDHVVVLGEWRLRRLLSNYAAGQRDLSRAFDNVFSTRK
jgi:hypothetical protein